MWRPRSGSLRPGSACRWARRAGHAEATAAAFNLLTLEECDQVAKPEWWSDEGLKALSARVVKAAPNDASANAMRALVLSGGCGAWAAGGLARQRSSWRRRRTGSGLRR